jgi:hypothetical protein
VFVRRRRGLLAAGVVVLALALTSVATAQFRGRLTIPTRDVPQGSFQGAFVFCRVAFRNQPFGDGDGWYVDYPRADINLSFRLAELTKTPIGHDETGMIKHVLIRLTDPELPSCPFIMMSEPGGAYFDEQEASALRGYLQRGGFLWVDDFWGPRAWSTWAGEIAKALPAHEFPIQDLPIEHELFHMLYDIREFPQVPSIGFWLNTGGQTSERGAASAEPHARAIFDSRGRIMVLMTHNTDFGDAFEREGDNHAYFLRFAPAGYAFGVNALLYAMTH